MGSWVPHMPTPGRDSIKRHKDTLKLPNIMENSAEYLVWNKLNFYDLPKSLGLPKGLILQWNELKSSYHEREKFLKATKSLRLIYNLKLEIYPMKF